MTQENALKIFKCLSDTSRLRIVQSLAQGEMYTELLAERLNLTPSTVSFHMKKLEDDSASNDGMVLNIALNYGGRAEITSAVGKSRRMLRRAKYPSVTLMSD